MTTRETRELFAPDEVARLKLNVLTSQNVEERIEALRKLVFAPLEGAQKAGIFVNVLTDREAPSKLRREAVRSLEQIGFRSDMADAVRKLFTESSEDAIYGIQRLGALLREAEEGEASLILAVLLEVLDQDQPTGVVRELLRLVGESAGLLVTNYQKTEQFAEAALRQLSRHFDELRHAVEEAFEACIERAPDLVADLVWRELERAEDPRVRSLLLNLSETHARTPERVRELAEKAVDELLRRDLPESEKARLRYSLVRLGEPAALVVLERISQASGVQTSELIRLVDVVCTESEVSDRTVEGAVEALLDLLKLADTATRRDVVQASVLADPRVPAELQRELSGELLTLMTELNLPNSLDSIQDTLQRIGPEAMRPAYEFMHRTYPSEPAERAAIVLAGIVQNHPERVGDQLAERVFDLCMGLLRREDIERGAFTMGLAAVAGYTRWGQGVFQSSLQELKNGLWRLPYSMDVLDALAVMAGSPNVNPEQQSDLLDLFDGIVRFQARIDVGVRRETEEGAVYEFGREVQFDVRAVPAAVRGLEHICISKQATDQMRTRIVKRLLVLWEGVSKVRIVWGPAAIDALIGAMCSAARSEHSTVQMRVRLGTSLQRFLNKLRVVRGLGDICSRPELSAQMHEFAVGTGAKMLDEWDASDMQDVERRLALVKAAGRIAANPGLDADQEDVQRLRERALQALFSGLREGMAEVRETLVAIRECPDIPDAQKGEIDERLAKALGLVKTGRRR
jgi:hypothetical protein